MKQTPEWFWIRVDVKSAEECWLWKHGRQSAKIPYGGLNWLGKHTKAHRVAYRLKNGDIPSGMVICHKCDVPLCCNPDHLFMGTQADNMRDCKAKGRKAKGATWDGGGRVLEVSDILAIRERFTNGGLAVVAPLAKEFGMSISMIRKIGYRYAWKHLP